MLPEREDLSQYKDKETLISGIRQQRLERERQQSNNSNNDGTTTIGGNTTRAASVSDILNRATSATRPGETFAVYGTDGGVEDSERGDNGLGEQLRAESSTATRSDGRTYQQERVRTKRRDSIGEIVGKYRQAFTSGGRRSATSVPPEPTVKERATVTGRKLSDVEAARLRPKLIEYILWQTVHMDQLIIATTRGHQPVEIWSTIDKTDAEIMADFMLARGRQDAKAAQAVRYLSVFIDRLKLGLIILPRMYQTALAYFSRGISIT